MKDCDYLYPIHHGQFDPHKLENGQAHLIFQWYRLNKKGLDGVLTSICRQSMLTFEVSEVDAEMIDRRSWGRAV